MKLLHNAIQFENGFQIVFHRTIRLPEDGQKHSLPPSMGHFPMKRIEDYADKVPASWKGHGGIFIPMYEREAMWMGFGGSTSAVKVATGKVNAVSGGTWTPELQEAKAVGGKDPEQDYMVGPNPQHWLDGFNVGSGEIRQFVGMAMGKGYTVEAQVTGKEDVGGIQILVVPPKPGKIKEPVYATRRMSGSANYSLTSMDSGGLESFGGGVELESAVFSAASAAPSSLSNMTRSASTTSGAKLNKSAEIGLAQGGRMDQQINKDPHGLDTWDQEKAEKIFVHIVNAELWEQITGEKCPPSPIPAQDYTGPYFNLNENKNAALQGSGTLANVKPVSQKDKDHGFEGQQDDTPQTETKVIQLGTPVPKNKITDGNW